MLTILFNEVYLLFYLLFTFTESVLYHDMHQNLDIKWPISGFNILVAQP